MLWYAPAMPWVLNVSVLSNFPVLKSMTAKLKPCLLGLTSLPSIRIDPAVSAQEVPSKGGSKQPTDFTVILIFFFLPEIKVYFYRKYLLEKLYWGEEIQLAEVFGSFTPSIFKRPMRCDSLVSAMVSILMMRDEILPKRSPDKHQRLVMINGNTEIQEVQRRNLLAKLATYGKCFLY